VRESEIEPFSEEWFSLVSATENYPIPRFGSPPTSWKKVINIIEGGGGIVALGEIEHHPVMAVVTASALAVIYMVKPSAEVARHGLAKKIAKALDIDFEYKYKGKDKG
jgi:hypothetical protein